MAQMTCSVCGGEAWLNDDQALPPFMKIKQCMNVECQYWVEYDTELEEEMRQ